MTSGRRSLYRNPMRSLPAIVALVISLAGCASDEALAHLIEIRGLTQTWENPNQLQLHGEGFPHGVRGEAILIGTLFAVGASPRPLTLRAPCRALSATHALVELGASEAAALDEGPFEGKLELRFGALASARLVGKAENVTLRVGSQPGALDRRFALRQRAQHFQRSLGITALELTEAGVVVSQLAAEGAARAAGLRVGDTVRRLDGAPVQLPGDLLGRGLRPGVELTVKRSGEPGLLSLKLQGAQAAQSLPWLASLLCAAFGAAIGATLGCALRPTMLWAPRRREYWLGVVSWSSLALIAAVLLDGVDPMLRELLRPFAYAFVSASGGMCLLRRLRPTLRTGRDPALAPLL